MASGVDELCSSAALQLDSFCGRLLAVWPALSLMTANTTKLHIICTPNTVLWLWLHLLAMSMKCDTSVSMILAGVSSSCCTDTHCQAQKRLRYIEWWQHEHPAVRLLVCRQWSFVMSRLSMTQLDIVDADSQYHSAKIAASHFWALSLLCIRLHSLSATAMGTQSLLLRSTTHCARLMALNQH